MPTPTRIPPTPTPVPPGVTLPPATPTPTPLPLTPTPSARPQLPGPTPTSTYSDAEWAKIVEAAHKEGKVMVYNWNFTLWREKAIKEGMKQAYGINVEVVSGPASVLLERIKNEARAGVYAADVFEGNPSISSGGLDKPGFFKAIDSLPSLRDAPDPNVWYYNPLLTPTMAGIVGSWSPASGNYTIITRVVPPEREPKKWEDLLDPWWKGKIYMTDPITTNIADYTFLRVWRGIGHPEGFIGLWYDLVNKDDGRLYFYLLGGLDPTYTGECALIFNMDLTASPSYAKYRAVYDKVTWTKLGTWEPPVPWVQSAFTAGVLKTAPHPNAALVFVNWMLSREGQTWYANERGLYTSMRRDVPDPVEPIYWPEKPTPTFWNLDINHYLFENYTFAKRTIFKLMREGMSQDAWLKELKDSPLRFWGQYPPPTVQLLPVPMEGR